MRELLDCDDTDAGAVAAILGRLSLDRLLAAAEAVTLEGHGALVTYSRKVFIPLTQLCRDVCAYCTFAVTPRKAPSPYLSREQVLGIARAGVEAGCREALFTLGDRPEDRYASARRALAQTGHGSTLEYLRDMAAEVLKQTGLLPHLNPGLMGAADYAMLRPVSASMGLMLETAAERLLERGGPHFGCPDKAPERRLAAIDAAGRSSVPFTTGLLIGIGETELERIEALLAIRALHRQHGHIQEVIIQNFRAKPGTRMSTHPEPSLEDQLRTIAIARLLFGPEMTIQAPPNLQPNDLGALLRAGVNDWGGVSPVTADHVNPEAPWPHLDDLGDATRRAGRVLRERLAIGPRFAREPNRWTDAAITPRVQRITDARGLPIVDAWRPGGGKAMPVALSSGRTAVSAEIDRQVARASKGQRLGEREVAKLFAAEGGDVSRIVRAADNLRRRVNGDVVTYVVNRNINYTNICLYKCSFCAFSKGSSRSVRGPAYRLDLEEIARRASEAADRGATEVCLQGGIHPEYDGNTYLAIVGAVRRAAPDMHIHAFSPLEVAHGARSLSLPLETFLGRLREAGLNSLPGTAAEILDDDIRAVICPDKVTTAEWLAVMETAHLLGLGSTATIMFGHVDSPIHWARHLLAIRDLQARTGGFTEFVPLPFVHMEAPMWRRNQSRSGPSAQETMLMHAIARLVLHPFVQHIQVSWVKLGLDGAAAMLKAGADDLGGVLMDESITRAAGGQNGQACTPAMMRSIAAGVSRPARQRTTSYALIEARPAPAETRLAPVNVRVVA